MNIGFKGLILAIIFSISIPFIFFYIESERVSFVKYEIKSSLNINESLERKIILENDTEVYLELRYEAKNPIIKIIDSEGNETELTTKYEPGKTRYGHIETQFMPKKSGEHTIKIENIGGGMTWADTLLVYFPKTEAIQQNLEKENPSYGGMKKLHNEKYRFSLYYDESWKLDDNEHKISENGSDIIHLNPTGNEMDTTVIVALHTKFDQYNVKTGGDRIRFLQTFLKDFDHGCYNQDNKDGKCNLSERVNARFYEVEGLHYYQATFDWNWPHSKDISNRKTTISTLIPIDDKMWDITMHTSKVDFEKHHDKYQELVKSFKINVW